MEITDQEEYGPGEEEIQNLLQNGEVDWMMSLEAEPQIYEVLGGDVHYMMLDSGSSVHACPLKYTQY